VSLQEEKRRAQSIGLVQFRANQDEYVVDLHELVVRVASLNVGR
jgi:hypothetical protein